MFYTFLKKVIKIKEIRCKKCNQLLLMADEVKGEIKCPRCKQINKLDYSKDRA
ncbi:Com family DNA-binding transcriptional regulator [Clostridium botulinum]|uniref:Com family DNA-binding transcriptional regulator n=1 Tax=Clostridium botulinum TaxID=1491 RepID=A0A6B4JSU6_CLOBO|nr:Com family DNA-binding transcriptional regulator [Clostridium botulinum]NFL53397.1 Com family DNA-binding transcriptional regulator [Clostridium botulinum]NFS16363.1 Com family DNA-binding transcriptional regulator [Clostridium botulinum]NFV27946.1 Com family DNA-binding transcriptional regulator [Clostridium botulinum]